jgi:hypothetical protein
VEASVGGRFWQVLQITVKEPAPGLNVSIPRGNTLVCECFPEEWCTSPLTCNFDAWGGGIWEADEWEGRVRMQRWGGCRSHWSQCFLAIVGPVLQSVICLCKLIPHFLYENDNMHHTRLLRMLTWQSSDCRILFPCLS